MRRTLSRSIVLAAVIAAVAAAAAAFAENVDPGNAPVGAQFAWGENVGWINAEPANSGVPLTQGVTVSGAGVTGFMYGENIGWINMNCANNATCGSTANYGIQNDGLGNLSGYAWGENVGWISFSCNNNPGTCATTGTYGVHINPLTGEWTGDAWGENIGWINFDHSETGSRIITDDFDGVAGAIDNCPFDAPGTQTNTDAGNTAIGFPGADVFGDVCDVDNDGDGCADSEEALVDPIFGGLRNPLFVWDFYDVDGTKSITLSDTLRVLEHFGHGNDDSLDNFLDRQEGTAPFAPKEALTESVNLQDALLNLLSFGHSCTAAP